VGVLGASVSQMLVRRFVSPATGELGLLALGLLPITAYLAATALALIRLRRTTQFDQQVANELFKFLGVISFAAAIALGFLVARREPSSNTLRDLSPLLAMFGAPSLAIGLLVWQRVADPKLSGERTAGTSVAVLGAVVMIAAIVLAWPSVARMAAVAIVDSVV